jgi:plastocyanin
MTSRRTVATVALVALLTIAAVAPATAVTIRGSGTRWRPSSVDINRGDRVLWRAVSGSHTVRAYGGNWTYSRSLSEGASVSRRFRQRGTFRFFCSIHGNVAGGACTGMCGRVLV